MLNTQLKYLHVSLEPWIKLGMGNLKMLFDIHFRVKKWHPQSYPCKHALVKWDWATIKRVTYPLFWTHRNNWPVHIITDHDANNIYHFFSTQNGWGTNHLCLHPNVLNCIRWLHQHHASPKKVANFRMLVMCDLRNKIGHAPKLQVSSNFSISRFAIIGSLVKLDEIISMFLHPLDSLYFFLIQNVRG